MSEALRRQAGAARGPQTGFALLAPRLLIDGGRALRGDVGDAEIAPDKFVSFADGGVTAVTPGNFAVMTLRWEFDGVVCRWFGYNANDETGDVNQGLLGVKMQLQLGGARLEELVIDGSTEKPTALGALFPYERGHQPIFRCVREGQIWRVQFNNTHSANTYYPDLLMGVRVMDFSECEAEVSFIR